MFDLRSTRLILIRHGLVVRIAGSHPAGPGSIPGGGNFFTQYLYSPRLEKIQFHPEYRKFAVRYKDVIKLHRRRGLIVGNLSRRRDVSREDNGVVF